MRSGFSKGYNEIPPSEKITERAIYSRAILAVSCIKRKLIGGLHTSLCKVVQAKRHSFGLSGAPSVLRALF